MVVVVEVVVKMVVEVVVTSGLSVVVVEEVDVVVSPTRVVEVEEVDVSPNLVVVVDVVVVVSVVAFAPIKLMLSLQASTPDRANKISAKGRSRNDCKNRKVIREAIPQIPYKFNAIQAGQQYNKDGLDGKTDVIPRPPFRNRETRYSIARGLPCSTTLRT